jgi:hypothetical protein
MDYEKFDLSSIKLLCIDNYSSDAFFVVYFVSKSY